MLSYQKHLKLQILFNNSIILRSSLRKRWNKTSSKGFLIYLDSLEVEVKDWCVFERVCAGRAEGSLVSDLKACRNVLWLWRVCCLCSTNMSSKMKGMQLHKPPSSPVLLRDPVGVLPPPPAAYIIAEETHPYWWAGFGVCSSDSCRPAEFRMK